MEFIQFQPVEEVLYNAVDRDKGAARRSSYRQQKWIVESNLKQLDVFNRQTATKPVFE